MVRTKPATSLEHVVTDVKNLIGGGRATLRYESDSKSKPGGVRDPPDAEILFDQFTVVAAPDDLNDVLTPRDELGDITSLGLPL
jgi:hypothetical protein